MYTKIFIPLTAEDIKKVNASELATKFEVSSSYVSRILKSEDEPSSDAGKKILLSAREIVAAYDNLNQS